MKKKLVYFLILVIAIIIQTSILPVILDPSITGDVVLMVVLAWSIIDGFSAFISWAILAGILYDLATYSIIGEHAIIFLLVVYFVSFFSRRLSLEVKGIGRMLFFAFVIVATFLSKSITALMMAWNMQTFHGYWKIFGSFESLTFQIICNGLLFFILFFMLKKIKVFFNLEK